MSDKNITVENVLNAKTWDQMHSAVHFLIRENEILKAHCDELKRIIEDGLCAIEQDD